MDFVAIDIETADAANSSPCAIGLAFVNDNVITKTELYLIDPETRFNPIASRIHGINADVIKDKPTLPEMWDVLYPVFSNCLLVAHNASFDVSVLQKAAQRYDLTLPKLNYACTMKASATLSNLQNTKLKTVCDYLGIEYEQMHRADKDAEACANVAIALLQKGITFNSNKANEVLSDEAALSALDDFERDCLKYIHRILEENGIYSELARYKKTKTLDINFFYPGFKIGTVRKRRFISVKKDAIDSVDTALDHDETSLFYRFFLQSPSDLILYEKYICLIAQKTVAAYKDYSRFVSERTVTKHLRDYNRETHVF